MKSTYLILFRGFLTNPQSTLKSLQQASLQSAFIYFISVWVVFAFLFCLVGWVQNLLRNTHDTMYLAAFAVTVFFGWLYFGLVIHAILRILSGPKSILKTYKAIFYAAKPLAVIGWIPDWRIIMYMGTYPYQPWYC